MKINQLIKENTDLKKKLEEKKEGNVVNEKVTKGQ